MKKIKKAMLKVNTLTYLAMKKFTLPLKNNKGSIIEGVGMILIALILLGIFLLAMRSMMDSSMVAVSSKMTGLFS